MTVHGVLLAAGAGRRMGMPKALVHDDAGSWLLRAVDLLAAGGCDGVTVVLGAAADEARALLEGVVVTMVARVVVAEDWEEGMAASMRAGLEAVPPGASSALVTLVDLPDLTPAVVSRVAALDDALALARAAYDGVPGHPVLLGRDHVAGVVATATGDRGARDYLASHEVTLVECGDLATGIDVDSR